jgi:NADPH:quinone reductase-like Zn-dependent oxidoreductase
LSETMKAAFLTGHGGNEVVTIGERPMPQRKVGEILVRIKAASVNRVDLYMRDSGAGITHSLPQIMGVDGAGLIEQADSSALVGRRVTLYPGIVCGACEFCLRGEPVLCIRMSVLGEHRDGTMAEFVCVPVANGLHLPDRLDFAQGAALGVNYLTAWRMPFTKAKLQRGETVLIFGIGGGVSLAALMIAKAAGARVFVTSRSAEKLARATGLGADATMSEPPDGIPGKVRELTEGRGVDVIIENSGGPIWNAALKCLVRGGRIVTCGATMGDQPPADLRRIFIRQLQIFGSTLGNPDEFLSLLEWCGQGRLRPAIDARYTLDQTHRALSHLESGKQFGKIAIEI